MVQEIKIKANQPKRFDCDSVAFTVLKNTLLLLLKVVLGDSIPVIDCCGSKYNFHYQDIILSSITHQCIFFKITAAKEQLQLSSKSRAASSWWGWGQLHAVQLECKQI